MIPVVAVVQVQVNHLQLVCCNYLKSQTIDKWTKVHLMFANKWKQVSLKRNYFGLGVIKSKRLFKQQWLREEVFWHQIRERQLMRKLRNMSEWWKNKNTWSCLIISNNWRIFKCINRKRKSCNNNNNCSKALINSKKI